MKRYLALVILSVLVLVCYGQYPGMDTHVKNMYGNSQPLKSYLDESDGHVTLFVFWKTCCPTNLSMIDSLIELKEEGDYSDKIKVVLVSVDDIRSSSRVLPVVKTKGWKDDVIMDTNMDLAHAMQVNIPPQWVAVDHKGNPIFRRKIIEGETDAEYYYNELITNIEEL